MKLDWINHSKLDQLKSLRKLKELFIGNDSDSDQYRHQNGDQIIRNCVHDFKVAMINTEDFREVEFCPDCHEIIWANHECVDE